MDELQEEMKGVRDGLSECYKANEKALGELNDVRGEKIECEEKLDFERQECSAEWFALNFSFAEFKEDCSEDIDSLREDLNEKVSDFEELERDYEKIVESSARSICCKKKVDDASINSFEVVGGKIVCLSGGENRLKC